MEKKSSDSEEMYVPELGATTNKKNLEWLEKVQFRRSKTVLMKLNTGAQCNVLSKQEASEAGLKMVP